VPGTRWQKPEVCIRARRGRARAAPAKVWTCASGWWANYWRLCALVDDTVVTKTSSLWVADIHVVVVAVVFNTCEDGGLCVRRREDIDDNSRLLICGDGVDRVVDRRLNRTKTDE
jgi:hypothetical protein